MAGRSSSRSQSGDAKRTQNPAVNSRGGGQDHKQSSIRRQASTFGRDNWSARQSLHFTSSKLSLVKNPVQHDPKKEFDLESIPETDTARGNESISAEHNGRGSGSKDSKAAVSDSISFYRRETVSMAELFYDLWFVANLNVFTTVHPVTEVATLASFIEYFLLLWTTWFVTTVFDARYGHDGVFERVAHAFHLAVMVGFAIVGVSFSENKLIEPVFRTTSLFLMISRLVLAIQYGLVLFHARHHRRSRNALMLATALHLLPAITYLLIALVSSKSWSRELFWVWVGISLLEMGAVILHSTLSRALSFEGTHFNERLSLLTLIVIGEGIIILTKNVSKIVEYTLVKLPVDDWSPALIGVIICSAATLYITFQLYFDWMHSHNIMKATQQAYWALIHLPFHIALFLLSEGGSQWDLWWRAIESFRLAKNQLEKTIDERIRDSGETPVIVESLKDKVYEILDRYGADVDEGGTIVKTLDMAFSTLAEIPNDFWDSGPTNTSNPNHENYASGAGTVLRTTVKVISDAYDVSVEDQPPEIISNNWQSPSEQAVTNTGRRLMLVLVYMFLSAGSVLLLLMLMHILSKRRGWSVFNICRTAIVVAVGLGLCLVALIATNNQLAANFLQTPWQLPTIAISYLFVLVLTHLPHPPRIFIKRCESEKDGQGKAAPEQPQSTRRRPSYGHNRLSSAANKQSVAIRRGITTIKGIRVEKPQGDPVAECSSPELHSDGGHSFEPPSTPFATRRRGIVFGA